MQRLLLFINDETEMRLNRLYDEMKADRGRRRMKFPYQTEEALAGMLLTEYLDEMERTKSHLL